MNFMHFLLQKYVFHGLIWHMKLNIATLGMCSGGKTYPFLSLRLKLNFLVLWDHRFHCGILKSLQGH